MIQDLISYEIEKIKPQLQVFESAVGSGNMLKPMNELCRAHVTFQVDYVAQYTSIARSRRKSCKKLVLKGISKEKRDHQHMITSY